MGSTKLLWGFDIIENFLKNLFVIKKIKFSVVGAM